MQCMIVHNLQIKLDGMLNSLEDTKDQLAKAEPISAHPEKSKSKLMTTMLSLMILVRKRLHMKLSNELLKMLFKKHLTSRILLLRILKRNLTNSVVFGMKFKEWLRIEVTI